MNVALNVLLVVVVALLGIVTNYATGEGETPFLLQLLQRVAVPAVGVLLLVLIVLTVAAARLDGSPPPARIWDPDRTPYPGLEAFAEDEAAVFFGRDDQVNDLVRELHEEARSRFVVVAGASGSGKSSLVQAGLIPRLKGRRWLVPPVFTPGGDPLASLARALGESGDPRRFHGDAVDLTSMIYDFRHRLGRRTSRVLLAVDQFEELLTLSGPEQREMFLGALNEALRADSRLWVVATARIEFLRDFLDGDRAALFSRPVAIGALTRADLATVVEAPGVLAGLRFAPGLVTRIVEDTGTSDALPLLAYLLQELYFAAGAGKVATFEDYARLGGVEGALARQADRVVSSLRAEEGIEPILAVLFRFVTTEGTEATRRRVPLAGLSENERAIVDAFVDARLLVTGVSGGQAIAQVAHEALFRQWAPLRQEVEARAEQLRQRAELERWAADWEQAGEKNDYLLTGERLQLALQWLESLESAGHATESIRTFVEASKRRDLVFLRRVSEGIGGYVLNNVERYPELAVLLSLAALSECPPTPSAARALMTALAHSHLSQVFHEHEDAVRNLAWSPDGRFIATASRDGTCRIWDVESGSCTTVLSGHDGMVEMVAWSPDSTRVATASRDRTVRVWEAGSGRSLAELRGAADVVRAVAWSPDGTRIAAGSRDLVVRLWDAASHEPVLELHGHMDNILGIAFSPDGRSLATGSHDRTVRIWDIAQGSAVVLEGHRDFVEGVSWSPDGTRVASAGGDGTARIWDVVSGRQAQLIRCHENRVWNVAWSPDGKYLATCGGDYTARVWDPSNVEEVLALRGHTSDVWGVVWAPDGSRLATGSADMATHVWEVSPAGAEQVLFIGHEGPIRDVMLGQGGSVVVSCGDDATVRIWQAATGEQTELLHGAEDALLSLASISDEGGEGVVACSADKTLRRWTRTDARSGWNVEARRFDEIPEAVARYPDPSVPLLAIGGHDRSIRIGDFSSDSMSAFTAHLDWVTGLSWSPSGRSLASTSDDRTARIWDTNISGAREGTVLIGHQNWVDDVSWSPDERKVVTGSADGTARVWNAETGEQLAVLDGHGGRVSSVAWSPDGTLIATASYDRTVRVWNARTHAEIGVVGVHRDRLTRVVWTPDSSRLVTGSFDGTIRVWQADMDLEELKDRARNRVFRALSEQERLAHLLPAGQ
ncbi:hypothetical protein GCM10010439_20620 [Actinocorallia aurantiaca]|uniref:Novel STAND NTPase 1 domain-containing protein n=1 Tax=Actinocorallia aurantiaca TaxID=46204 RepID=A0ABP6GHT7_9ACTN